MINYRSQTCLYSQNGSFGDWVPFFTTEEVSGPFGRKELQGMTSEGPGSLNSGVSLPPEWSPKAEAALKLRLGSLKMQIPLGPWAHSPQLVNIVTYLGHRCLWAMKSVPGTVLGKGATAAGITLSPCVCRGTWVAE